MFRTSLFLLCVLLPTCLAQETTATLLGTATDSTGAVLPNVVIKATNLATNASRQTTSDASGNYSIPFLPAGDYTINASLAGFQAQKIDRITLQVQQSARVDPPSPRLPTPPRLRRTGRRAGCAPSGYSISLW